MRSLLSAIMISALWLVLFTLSLNAQTQDTTLQSASDLTVPISYPVPQQDYPIPPLETPAGIVITVTTPMDELNNENTCSLRQAIQAANEDMAVGSCPAGNGEDLIILATNIYTLTREGSGEDNNASGDLDIRSSMVISGAGAEKTIIDANGIDRVLHVHEGSRVELRGLTLRNGQPGDGEPAGGVYNTGILTLTAVTVAHNVAGRSFYDHDSGHGVEGGSGGGIANEGILTLIASIVRENHCGSLEIYWSPGTEHYGPGAAGGGIFSSGMLTIINSSMLSNTSGYGGPFSKGGNGGGVSSTGVLSITNSVIAFNHTGIGGWLPKGAAPSGNGSGIAVSGTATITNSYIHSNRTYDFGYGSGIYNAGTTQLIASEINGNLSGFLGEGSGVYNDKNLSIVGSTIFGNQSGGGGRGGGIFNNGTLYITQSTVSSNRSGDAASYISLIRTPGGDGGGIYNQDALFIQSSTIAENATGEGVDQPGCENSWVDCTGGSGGGIANVGALSIRSSIVAQNKAAVDASGPDCWGSINSYGYNLIGEISSCTLVGLTNRDIYGRYAWLAPLANNGGRTSTHALLPYSPAIDAGSCTAIDGALITTDQRGTPRPQGEDCDIGAFESALSPITLEMIYLPVLGN
jgi:CSLREA domain-containing protein